MSRPQLAWVAAAFVLAPLLNGPVAWALLLEQPVPGRERTMTPPELRATWDRHVPDGAADEVLVLRDATDFIGYRRVRIQGGSTTPASLTDPTSRTLKVERAGFPFESLGSERRWGAGGDALEGAIAIAPRRMSPGGGNYGVVDALPLRPSFPGFWLNTWLYAHLFLAPLLVHLVLRHRRRGARRAPSVGRPVGAAAP
ncbi:MAG TPA: hypothetical protein RMH99_28365 [Sandaracinaceae bacterium LLY-WYZ-13_1]|nr:hypothetical protein [Sandaracinaceae bacterium LLY-WYZ-13_1]